MNSAVMEKQKRSCSRTKIFIDIYIYIYIYHVERGKSPLCVHACPSSAYSPTVAKKNEYTSSISNQNTIFIVSPI
jgi:Fe-S-cluster-containing dehydrogenase component